MSPWEKGPKPKIHRCNQPNAFKAIAAGKVGRVWRCGTCKRRWELVTGDRSRKGDEHLPPNAWWMEISKYAQHP